ncbi:Conserved hypothetical protein [Shewanella piezotolerans WP3]|uniref:Phosphate transport regulator n=1 Tax=Shewanella piezotolerans (strain WP3 / JCM 13877) TaxID=225849 RepID=B8CHE8_SHEPW|nr:DUF47 family protein [Shewanella piezotolerans]ACJ27074.1 Conserved hypothetical protein [Shewanella piezotolerans WP3]
MFGFSRLTTLLSQSESTETKVYLFFEQVTLSHHKSIQMWKNYLTYGATSQEFEQALTELQEIEHQADNLKREIEQTLYRKTLIPDLRSDVASLIDLTDRLINKQETIGLHLKIEQPLIPQPIATELLTLLDTVGETIDHTLLCAKSFFTDLQRVQEYHTKVIAFESEADRLCTRTKVLLFDTDLPLVNKIQLRYFCDRIDQVANLAEDISDRIAIFTLKRVQ